MLEAGAYGKKFGDCLSAESVSAFVSRRLPAIPIAVTEIRADRPKVRMSDPIPAEDAYLVATQVRDYPAHEYWEDGRHLPVARLPQGSTCIYDLKRGPTFLINSPFHTVHFYFPRKALIAISGKAETSSVGELRYTPGTAVNDNVMRALTTSLLPVFEAPQRASSLFLDHIMLAAGAHVARTYGGMATTRPAIRGGLAPWQEHRAKELLMSNLEGEITLDQLAQECGLSMSHFARAFRQSAGMAPHQWLTRRRIEAAMEMLRDGLKPLAEIATACGFADQSHLTRVFSRHAGISPGAWRRTRR